MVVDAGDLEDPQLGRGQVRNVDDRARPHDRDRAAVSVRDLDPAGFGDRIEPPRFTMPAPQAVGRDPVELGGRSAHDRCPIVGRQLIEQAPQLLPDPHVPAGEHRDRPVAAEHQAVRTETAPAPSSR